MIFPFIFLAALGLHCCMPAFSRCGEPGLLSVVVSGLLMVVASLVAEHRLQGMRAQQLWCMGLVAPWHAGSSSTRDQTCIPCIGRQILIHCTTGQSLLFFFYTQGFDSEWPHGLLVRMNGGIPLMDQWLRPCSSSCSVQLSSLFYVL